MVIKSLHLWANYLYMCISNYLQPAESPVNIEKEIVRFLLVSKNFVLTAAINSSADAINFIGFHIKPPCSAITVRWYDSKPIITPIKPIALAITTRSSAIKLIADGITKISSAITLIADGITKISSAIKLIAVDKKRSINFIINY